MVGVFAFCLPILHILYPPAVNGGLTCPEGVTSFSHGVQSNTYYACAEDSRLPILRKCDHGQFYWAYKKACHSIQNSENADPPEHSDLRIYTRPVLGDPVFLGDLYNSNTDEVLTGYSFWKSQTILKNKKRRISPSSSVDIFGTRSTFDRLQRSGFSSAVKLDVLGDMVRLEGSAKYFQDKLESDNEVAVVLSYQATTVTETLPVSTPEDFDYCGESGPTHVITSVTYGIGANFVFKKSLVEGDDRDKVTKKLKTAVDAIKKTKTNISDTIKKIVENIRVDFFSDFVPVKEPSDYEESVKMYKSLPARVGKYPNFANDTITTRMKLMPISRFCRGKKISHIAIANDILNSVNEMLADMEKTKLTIHTLKMEQAVQNYRPLLKILQTLRKGLTTFELHLKTHLQDILPRIQRGNSSEEDLIELLDKYAKSPFYYDKVENFLDNRRREISMLNEIIDPQKLKGTDIKVLDYKEATDTRTMFIKPYVLMLKYNVLPSKTIVNKFLKGETVDETKAWYNNDFVISAMGVQFNNFIRFSSANTNSKTRGFLLAIVDAKNGVNDIIDDIIKVKAQKEGMVYTFEFPDIPPTMTEISNTHSSMTLTVTRPTNTWVTSFSVSYWLHGKQVEMVSKVYRFSKTNVTTIKVDELTANNLYGFSMQYVTPMGLSPPSPSISFYTRPCSPPSNLRITTLGADNIKMDWDTPSTCGKGVRISKYRVTVDGDGSFSKTVIVNNATTVQVNRLQPGSKYLVSIEGIADAQNFNVTQNVILTTLSSSKSFYTRPDAPSHLSLVNVSIHSAVVEWFASCGAVIEKYRVKYVKINSIGNVTVRGTEMVMTSYNTSCRLTDLIQGTTYAVSVQVLTSKGDSDFSTQLLMTTRFVKSELDNLRDSLNQSVALIEKQLEEVDDRFNTTDVTIKAMASSMVYYPRLRSEGHLVDAATGCGGTINTGGRWLWYPADNNHYHAYSECTWNIKTGLPTTLTTYYWNVYCGDGYVSVYDEELLVKKSCNSLGTIHTRSGNVYVRFYGGASGSNYGFRFDISVQSDKKRLAGQRYYPQYKATFTGYGSPKSFSEHHTLKLPRSNSSIPTCLQDCRERYTNDHDWKGISIELESNPIECSCYKNPVGFVYALTKFQYDISG